MCRLNEKIFHRQILKDMTVTFAETSPWRCWQGILVKTAPLNCAGSLGSSLSWQNHAAENRYSTKKNNDIKKV
jgi:hypothetical protein